MILITGSSGMLGKSLIEVLLIRKLAFINPTHQEMDITDKKRIKYYFEHNDIKLVIHLAAFTDVDAAEKNKFDAYKINCIGTSNITKFCKKHKSELIFISTDFVFDGYKFKPYKVDSIRNPLNYYGITKKLAEDIVIDSLSQFYIIRTSWLFNNKGNKFINSILNKAINGETIEVVEDQYGSPTHTEHLANCILKLYEDKQYGVHHIVNKGFLSRYEFSKNIVEAAGLEATIVPISSSDLKIKTLRPSRPELETDLKICEGMSDHNLVLNEILREGIL
jgi:dTDP-4-dehydrorhamnose reductase